MNVGITCYRPLQAINFPDDFFVMKGKKSEESTLLCSTPFLIPLFSFCLNPVKFSDKSDLSVAATVRIYVDVLL